MAIAASAPFGSTIATRSPRSTPDSRRRAAKPVGEAVQLAVGQRPLLGHDRLPLRVAGGGGAQVLSQRACAQAELRFRSTYATMASIEPKFSSVISMSSTVIP